MQTTTRLLGHFINGEEQRAGNRVVPVWNPSTGDMEARVALADAFEVDEAVSAASEAFTRWSETPAQRRATMLFAFRERMLANIERLARVISSEHGKTLPDAKAEIARGLDVVEFACGIAHLLKGEFTADVGRNIDAYSHRQPLGVCAGITPFNFPAMVPMWMFPIAIACGNTFVLKPSEKDPSLALEMARLFHEAGLPPGVFNVVNGDAQTVDALLDHEGVAAISFVGSTPVARHVFTQASGNGKRVQALGGAKNHLVVLGDAAPDETVDAIVGAAYGSAGERCMAVSVVVAVGDQVADDLVSRLRERIASLRIGTSEDPDAEMGPLVTREHRERVASYIAIGKSEGAAVVIDGREAKVPGAGFFLGASLLDHVTPQMRVYRDEIFGPVLCIVRVQTLDDALGLIADNEFGNGASIFTRDGAAARYFEHNVAAGMVGINVPIPVPMAFHSFGGWKNSLFGDHHIHGPEGVRFYTRLKTTTARWSATSSNAAHFVMPTTR
ncbi:MAG TPA: CoA-acylating methylmalonate-semialdehyde dehydrogenase [Candidatus Baltobacteraceae bacterium]|nr:CoA-acylating methylmalonate-semialdehyde dehydrogenase [Candidatus Baltobacteraceae bacterium]